MSREEERENPNQKKKNRLKTEIPPQIQIIHPSTLTIEEEEEENQKKKKSNQSTIRPKNQKKNLTLRSRDSDATQKHNPKLSFPQPVPSVTDLFRHDSIRIKSLEQKIKKKTSNERTNEDEKRKEEEEEEDYEMENLKDSSFLSSPCSHASSVHPHPRQPEPVPEPVSSEHLLHLRSGLSSPHLCDE